MKIIQIIPDFGMGGAEIMCENLIYELHKMGHQVIALSLSDNVSVITERMKNSGVDVRFIGKKTGCDLPIIFKLIKIFRNEKPDVIHTHRHVTQYVIPAAILTGIKIKVHTIHNMAVKESIRPIRMLNKIFYKFYDLVPVSLSEKIRDTIFDEYHISKDKIPIIFNGIDLSKCNPKNAYEINGTFKILHVGRFSEQKNHIGLIESFKIFNNKYPNSELQLIGNGKLLDDIKTMVKENNMENSVKFLGLQSNVYDFMKNADIFTLPSIYEGVPITLIEAMGTGLPIVATSVGGIADMLSHNKNSLLTNVDSTEISNAFEKYYSDIELRKLHGENARKKSTEYSAELMAKKYLEIYKGANK